jgi:glycine/D-amino acid oxidase-like deaminating enzyme
MDLHSGKLYWPTTLPAPPSYPALEENINCDVLIIGGGSSGAQCAYDLCETGLDIVVVDKRCAGTGSTVVNTALLQYLGDKMLFELVNSFGEEAAIFHTKLCEEAISDIEKASAVLAFDTAFKRRDSLCFASDPPGIEKLQKEYHYLKKHQFKADYLTREEISTLYPFTKESALYLYNDAELNPFTYTHGLLAKAHERKVRIYEHTNINGKTKVDGQIVFHTDKGNQINAKHVIIACGYEDLSFKREKNAVLISSYAVVTNPVEHFNSWHKQTLIWETARPYLYMRTTKDNRIIIGGLDEDTAHPEDRDSKIMHKKEQLIRGFNRLFPNMQVKPEYYLGAFYAGTHDGLPLIGTYEEFPNSYFLYPYGDNGLVYISVLSKVLRDKITKGSHPAWDLYNRTKK